MGRMSLIQYLTRYAEPDCALGDEIADACIRTYSQVLCIPAFGEDPAFLGPLLAQAKCEKLLVILVVNAPPEAQEHMQRRNRDLITGLVASHQTLKTFSSPAWMLAWQQNVDLLLVDRSIPGYFLDPKGGVGLARKIACDIACKLFSRQVLTSPWIHITDADAVLPTTYFSASRQLDPGAISAAIYPFVHDTSSQADIAKAQMLYDTSLHYYVDALAWAGSPWAFHTIGSTLLVNAVHYAQARGFPRRQAGEDFYLLNKLAKLGKVALLDGQPIRLASRFSDRVPFGTGPALRHISALAAPEQEYLYYHPDCFEYLKAWQLLLPVIWSYRQHLDDTQLFERLQADIPVLSHVDSSILLEALRRQGLEKALDHAASHSTTQATFNRHLQHWFDGFRTLKFIHWLRENHFPSIPLEEARELAPHLFRDAQDASHTKA